MSAPALPKRIWAPLLVLLLVAGVVSSVLRTETPLLQTRTSYGGPIYAWGASYDLLRELGLHVVRSRARLADRDVGQPQWIIDPTWSELDVPHELESIERFAESGGTVVLIGAGESVWRELSLGPAEGVSEGEHGEAPRAHAAEQHAADEPDAHAREPQRSEVEPITLRGRWLRGARRVAAARGASFDRAAAAKAGFEPRVEGPAGTFVVERAVGAGKVVAVADYHFLTNEHVGETDDAPFLVDLALAYGAPSFDERCHGLTLVRSPWEALGSSFLLLASACFGALTLVALARARHWPTRTDTADEAPAPTLEVFVSSLGNLYRARGQGEPAAVFRAYRQGYLRRLQRALFGEREISQARFELRVRADAERLGPVGRWLREGAAPATTGELTKAVCALERYAAASTRAKRKR